MEDQNIQIFINCVRNYFETVGRDKAVTIEPPYLLGNEQVIRAYTGSIGVAGNNEGAVIFTCSPNLLDELLSVIGEPEATVELRMDMVGEVANTIAGNLRREFGRDFMISVPIVMRGAEQVRLPKTKRNLVIPLVWHGLMANVIVCLNNN